MGGPSYTAIPGSDRLRTKKRGESVASNVEAADAASLARVDVELDGARVSVGRVVLQGPQVPLLIDVVDRLFPLLEAEELAVYVHLYRLAVADEKNVCRVSRVELSRRTRLADRRLGRAIAGLVEKKAIYLVDRSRDGTLYRVNFPDDVTAEAPAKKKASAATLPTTTLPTTTLPTTTATTTTATTVAPAEIRSVGDVCRWFAATHGAGPGRSGADVASTTMELLEEGLTFARIPALLTAFVQAAPKTTPLRDLNRYVDVG